MVPMLIPNGDNAVVDIRKLRDYCLNPEHDDGKSIGLRPDHFMVLHFEPMPPDATLEVATATG